MAQTFFRRLDSLFVRFLLIQLGLLMALLLVFVTVFYVMRTGTIAALYTELWAPQMVQAAGVSAGVSVTPRVQRSDAIPANVRALPPMAPRHVALRQRLLAYGLQVLDMQLSRQGAEAPLLWVQVLTPDGRSVWLGVPGTVAAPEWSARILTVLVAMTLLVIVISWIFTRRLTRPLEQLRQRMQTHAPGSPLKMPPLAASSSPEIVAIDKAYTQLLARLEQHRRERSVLLAGVSHDLRSPLARIRMAAGLLPDAAGSTTRQDSIARNVVVADQLIESFLDYVRSDTLAFDQSVDLAQIARSVASRFERPNEELSVVAPATLLWPKANALLVDRLMSNLIDNAFKYGRSPVLLRLQEHAQQVSLEVQDAGNGIAPADVSRLQEAFSRGNNSRAVPGTGLGLAIVTQIAQRLGASLDFEARSDAHIVRLTLTR